MANLGEKMPFIGRNSIVPSLKYKGPSEPKDIKPDIKLPEQQSRNMNNK